MIRTTRAYRLVTATLGLSLLLSIGLPIVQHVCAMTAGSTDLQESARMHACQEHEHVAETPDHCEATDASASLSEACCLADIQGALGVEALPTDRSAGGLGEILAPLTAEIAVPAPEVERAAPPGDERIAPSRPVSLHVLHATFLN